MQQKYQLTSLKLLSDQPIKDKSITLCARTSRKNFFCIEKSEKYFKASKPHGQELVVLHAIVSFGRTIREPKCKSQFKFIVEAYLIMKYIGVTCHNYIVIAPSLYLGCVFSQSSCCPIEGEVESLFRGGSITLNIWSLHKPSSLIFCQDCLSPSSLLHL